MIIVYLNKKSLSFVIATNLKTISRFSDIKYSQLYNRLSQKDYYEDEETILFKGELVKGMQKIKTKLKKQFNKQGIEKIPKAEFEDMFSQIKM